jgi:hypothetical protein
MGLEIKQKTELYEAQSQRALFLFPQMYGMRASRLSPAGEFCLIHGGGVISGQDRDARGTQKSVGSNG